MFSAHFSKGQAAGALNFAGGDDVVFFPYNSSPWALGNSFSIEMWLNPNSSGYQLLMYPGYGCSYCAGYVLSIGDDLTCYSSGGNAGKLVFQGSNGKVVSDNALTVGVWTHIAVTYDGQVLKMYINGILQQSMPKVVATVSTGPDRQMGCDNAGCGARFGYNGSIDEFRIWSGPRSQYEIQTYMNCEFTTTPSSLTANYHFNHGIAGGNNSTVNTLVDASASGVDGDVYSGIFALTGSTSNWVAGAIANGYTTTASPTVAINVQGNGSNISDGDSSPSTSDHTDFNGALTRTFVIQNTTPGGTLNVVPYLTGPDAACFSITSIPAATVNGVGSTSLVITMVTGGNKSATVNINSNDGTTPVYDFVITASSIKYEAINFDGVDDYIYIPRNIDYDFTIEFWMRSTSTVGIGATQWYHGAGLVDGDVGGFQEDFGISLAWNKVFFGVGSGGGDVSISSTSTVNTGQWVHVAATRNGNTGAMNLYINGVLESTGFGPGGYKFSPPQLALGSSRALNVSNFYNGDLDEVRIWNTIRTQSQIQNFMNCEIPNSATFLVANYHFNEGTATGNASVTTLIDNSDQNYFGTGYTNGSLTNFALTGTTSNWIAPGKVPTGYTTQSSSLAVIGLTGNGNTILNNASTSSTVNLTNFQSNATRTFVITNTGTGVLDLNAVQLVGTNSAEFSITVMPSTSLTTSGTTSFVVAFTPTAGGVRSASIQIASTDNAAPLFSFLIEGQAPLAEALGIDGSNDYAYRTILTSNTSSITMEAKVYWYGPNTFDQMLMYNGNSSIRGYGIYFSAVGQLYVLFGGGSFPAFNYTLTPNVWTSLAVVLKPGIAELYVNGVLIQTANTGVPGTPNAGVGDRFALGSNDLGTQNFSGRLDEVRFWNKSLTQCEIQTYLNCEIPGSMPSLLANYHFNQGAAGLNNAGITNIVDASGNGNDLTLLNCSLTGTFENWVSPGAVVSGYTVTATPSASISLTGNGNPISNNATTVSTTNSTDFGAGVSSATYVINNTTGTLNIGNIVITGANASQYSVTVPPASSLVGAGSTSFVVSFTAAYGGPQSATVNVYTNDCSNPIYNFAIAASAPLASALNLDGTDDCISLPVNGNIPVGNSPYTLEAKIKPDVHATNGIIGWGNYGTNNQTNALRLGNGGSTGYVVYNYWFGNDIYMEVPNLADGNWHHIAATWDGTTRKIYLDGALMKSDNPGSNSVPNNGSMYVGMTCPWCGGEFFDGQIDEVRVWNYARTQCELRTFKDCEIPGSVSGLVLNYHLNQGSANMANPSVTVAFDASSNGLNGGLVNMSMTGTVSNWVSPGSVVNDYTISSNPTESIVVTGSAVVIVNNTSTVSTADGTDFGSASSRAFVIQNSNTGTLTINNVSLTGANASEFSITSMPSSTLAGLATTTFVIAFTPTASGIRTASIVINNSDCNQGTFKYAIEGQAPTASALDFDGSDDYVDCGTDPSLDITAGTWESWVNVNTLVSPQRIFFKEIADGTYGGMYELFISGGYFVAELKIGSVNHQITSTTTLSANAWYHVAVTYDGTAFNLYVNGVLEATDLTASGPMNPGTGHLCLGATGTNVGAAQLYAKLDEARLWNVARSQCEIQTYMSCEIPSTASGLLLNYHFNQGSHNLNNSTVTTLTNAASAISHGTLMNFALTGTTSNWVAPGSFANGYTISSAPTASIGVTGNGNPVTFNSTTVSTTNHTDFGSVATRTFVITNTSGSGTLQVGTPYITGTNSAEFSVTVLPSSSTLTSLASTSFVVAFTPTAGGPRNATINIGNNDCGKPIFAFAIQGTPPAASALDFDGTDDVVDCGTILTGSYTKEAWIKMQTGAIDYDFISGGNGLTLGHALFAPQAYGYKLASGHDGTWSAVMDPTPLLFNTWYHVAVTYDAPTTTMRLYKNGVLVSSNYSVAGCSDNHVYIGAIGSLSQHKGTIDEVRIWNTARSQCEIQTYMNCEIPTTATGLLANYHFNQGSQGLDNTAIATLTDAAGANTGTLSGFALTGASSNWVSPSNIVNGYSISVAPTSSIGVTGNGNPVTYNSSTVSTTNHTDFGSASTRTFVITNTSGSGTLDIGTPYLTGANASEFSVTVLPSTISLTSLASTSFVVAFTPTAGGLRNATVNITNNDCSKPIFNFAIQGAAPTASALTFDGVDDYIDAPSTGFSTGNNDMTFEFWVKPRSVQTGHRWITSLGTSTSGSLMTVGYDGSSNNRIRVHHFGPDLIATTASLTPNVWTHVAVNYRGTSFTSDIFINGVFIETLSFGAPLTIPVNPVFQIGTYVSNSTYCPNMDLDELRVWNRALCQQEIQNNMNCEIATTAPGLVANYHFNQGAVGVDNSPITSLTDVSGSANTGTLTSFSYSGTASNWSGPGAVNSGSSCSVFLFPEINLVGNGQNIVDGDVTPSINDNTNFGAACANSVVIKTFTIQNTGTGTLSIGSIIMSGADASSFSVSAISPASPVSVSGTATFAVTFTPTSTGVKNATINISSNDCDEATYDFALTGTCNAIPSVSVSTTNSMICKGFTTSVSGSGASTYTWLGGTPTITNSVAFSPTVTGSYTLSGTDALTGCTSTNAPVQTITVNPIPTVTANATSSLICNSGTITLSGSGADTYTWVGGPPAAINGIAFNPTITTSYTVSGTYTLTGCVSTNIAVQTISVNPTPTVSIVTNTNVVCFGIAPTLTASGAITYTWNPGNFTTAIVNPTPATTTAYTLTGSSPAGCTSTNLAQQIVSVNPLPIVTATAISYSICLGGTTAVNANGANNYNWTGSLQNNVAFSPNATTSYTVTGTDANGCQNTTSLTITVEALPSVTPNITSTSVCTGSSLTLFGNGANTYTWTGGVTDNQSFAPAATNSYTLTGISPAGCSSTNAPVVSVTVNALPIVVANTSSTAICEGQMVTLTGSGAVTYAWSDGVTDNVAFGPTVTTIYTVTGTDVNSCQNTGTVSITVNNLPSLSVIGTSTASCEAESNTLTVSGANTYSWSTNETDTAIVVSPTVTATYTVIGTTLAGCSNTAVYTQSVNPCLGTLTAIPSNTNVSCGNRKDGAITLSVSNSYSNSQISYMWTPSSLCPGNDCPLLNNLDVGIYSVTVKVTYTLNKILVKTDSIVMNPIVIEKQVVACDLKVYSGLTPNADGDNDTWQIENIDQFPNNKVMVFNRWGVKIFEINGYNNLDKAWPLNGDTSKLSSSTYFYIVDPGDGSKPLKGWVELIKN